MTTKEWAKTWAGAGEALKEIRDEEIRATDTVAALRAFEGLVLAHVRNCPPEPTSGLVEQQKWFLKIGNR